MDVFGSSPVGKLNNLIRGSNRHYDNVLEIHRTLIDGNSVEITALSTATGVLTNKLNTQFALLEVHSEKFDTLTENTRDSENKKNTYYSTLINDHSEKIDELIAKMKSLETLFNKSKSDTEQVRLMLINRIKN